MKKIVILMALLTGAACAKSADDQGIFVHPIGQTTLTTLSEGPGTFSPDILLGATPEMLPADGLIPKSVNAFLWQTPDRKVLIDAGTNAPQLLENLAATGVTPDQITDILLTHTHGDHTGGLAADGKAIFPNATLRLSRPEADWWGTQEGSSLLALYRGRIEQFEIEQTATEELWPGISAVGAFGHTPGHVGYLLENEGESLFVWGDLAHAMVVQMPHPEVCLSFDSDPDLARASRLHWMVQFAAQGVPVAGMHIPWPAMGMVKSDGAGYKFTPMK